MNSPIRSRIDPIDPHVGQRVRRLRREREISQLVLADALNITVEQLQRYERGASRLTAAMLFRIARELCVRADDFFATEIEPEDGVQRQDRRGRPALRLVR